MRTYRSLSTNVPVFGESVLQLQYRAIRDFARLKFSRLEPARLKFTREKSGV